ncbi:hypothetical protein HPP92_014018 [Vanilla planifolia]|uniref:Trehalase n=1 Tax=Vanilla planifolia TaxID=51239 RepID=A0A835QT16_VANPL|nr:hypothetical protein HPP92_014018 [Vanilla planifolia]
MPSLRFLFYFFHFIFFSTLLSAAMSSDAAGDCAVGPAESSVPLVSFLQRLQSEALKTFGPKSFDPKLYVDLPLKQDLVVTEEAFAKLQRVNGTITLSELEKFVNSFFGKVGDDLVYEEPKDFVLEPEEFLPKVKNPKVRAWALQVHCIWKNLSRRVSDDVREWPERHTLLPLPEPVVIPGSRFREVYYWDSYWIVRGLLVSKMYDTAKAVVNNLLWLIEVYGHVLNGARVYYSNRSQPPLLTSMVREIYMKTGDLVFAKKALPLLIKEHLFWNSGFHRVVIQDLQGREHSLSRHYAFWDTPRPESATIDKESASKLPSDSDKEAFYRQVASAAETGWDFSSRWMRDSSDLTTLSTTSIIPVDLNAYLYKMELDLAFLAKKVGDATISKNFKEASNARLHAMTSILWNAEMNQWLDYWLSSCARDCEDKHQFDARNQNDKIFASNFIPLWTWNHKSDTSKHEIKVENILESFQNLVFCVMLESLLLY